MSRPTTKEDGRRIQLYLSKPGREKLGAMAKRKKVSQSQVVEDLIEQCDEVPFVVAPQANVLEHDGASTPGLRAAEEPKRVYGAGLRRRASSASLEEPPFQR